MSFLSYKIDQAMKEAVVEALPFFDEAGYPEVKIISVSYRTAHPSYLHLYLAMGRFLEDKSFQAKYTRLTRFLTGLEILIKPTFLISILFFLIPIVGISMDMLNIQISSDTWEPIVLLLFIPLASAAVLYGSIFQLADFYVGRAYKKKLASQQADPIAQPQRYTFSDFFAAVMMHLFAALFIFVFGLFFLINLIPAGIIFLFRWLFGRNSVPPAIEEKNEVSWKSPSTMPDEWLIPEEVMEKIYEQTNALLKAIHAKHYHKIPELIDLSQIPPETLQQTLEEKLAADEVDHYLYFSLNEAPFFDSLVVEPEGPGEGYIEMELYIEEGASPITLSMNYYFKGEVLTKLVLVPF